MSTLLKSSLKVATYLSSLVIRPNPMMKSSQPIATGTIRAIPTCSNRQWVIDELCIVIVVDTVSMQH